jgi:hypothetical protein
MKEEDIASGIEPAIAQMYADDHKSVVERPSEGLFRELPGPTSFAFIGESVLPGFRCVT